MDKNSSELFKRAIDSGDNLSIAIQLMKYKDKLNSDLLNYAVREKGELVLDTVIANNLIVKDGIFFENLFAALHSHMKDEIPNILYLIGDKRLIYDALLGDIDAIRIGLESGANLNMQGGPYKATPLMYACSGGHLEAVEELINRDADVSIIDGNNQNVLTWALNGDHLNDNFRFDKDQGKIVNLLIKKNKCIFNTEDKWGVTTFMLACHHGNLNLVKKFLRLGIDPSKQDSDGNTALMYAWSSSKINALVNAGFNVNHQNNNEETALFQICEIAMHKSGYIEDIQTLLGLGANVNLHDHNGTTPLMALLGAGRNNTGLVELLLQTGANPNCVDKKGNSAMSIAHKLNRKNCIALLKKFGFKHNPVLN